MNILWANSIEGSKNQPPFSSWQRLHWNRSDFRVVSQQLPTVWFKKILNRFVSSWQQSSARAEIL
jgi:hypothetical protein